MKLHTKPITMKFCSVQIANGRYQLLECWHSLYAVFFFLCFTNFKIMFDAYGIVNVLVLPHTNQSPALMPRLTVSLTRGHRYTHERKKTGAHSAKCKQSSSHTLPIMSTFVYFHGFTGFLSRIIYLEANLQTLLVINKICSAIWLSVALTVWRSFW